MKTTGTVDSLNAALAGRYRIERELRQGGMATVYFAEDVKHKRKMAVKILRPDLAAALGSERFLREIETKSAHAACSRTSGFVVAQRNVRDDP